jgi:hypothetical protein
MHRLPEYDKSKWSHGEWDNEPDRVDFIHAGFSCFILRNLHGNWCGYVGVPKEHPAYSMDMDDIPVEVHGGVTYKDKCNDHICHTPQEGMPDDVEWIGFDTMHRGDLSPSPSGFDTFHWGDLSSSHFLFPSTYKNQEYATNQTKSLAEQLEKMK